MTSATMVWLLYCRYSPHNCMETSVSVKWESSSRSLIKTELYYARQSLAMDYHTEGVITYREWVCVGYRCGLTGDTFGVDLNFFLEPKTELTGVSILE